MAITLIAGAAAGAAVALGAGIVTAIAVGIGAAAVFDYVMDSMMEDASVDTMGGRTVTKKDPTATRKMVYGTCRVGGTIVYQANSGEDNKYLHNFIVFAEGGVEEITKIFFDDVTVYAKDHETNTYKYYGKYSNLEDAPTTSGNKVLIELKTGTTDGVSHGSLPSQWTGAHDLSNLTYAYVRLEYSDEIYTNGFPKITALVKGKKLYDPRQDDTATDYNGSGDQRLADPSTWEFSNNSAVCLLNYMIDDRIGLGESIDSFDATSLKASMDDCDVGIMGQNNVYTGTALFEIGERYRITVVGDTVDWASIGADSDPEVNDIFTATGIGQDLDAGGRCQRIYDRYTCDGIIDSKNSHKANIQNILTSMNGQLLYSSGLFHIKSYKYETPHADPITEDMILGKIDFSTKSSRRNLYNRVKGKFVSAEDNYVMTEYPAQVYEEGDYNVHQWEIDDGEVLYHEQNLPMTTRNVTAQRLARLTLLRSRMQTTIKFTTNAKGLVYTVGDNVKITNSTLGITNKIFQIQRLNIKANAEDGLTVDIEAKENVESFYQWQDTDLLDFTTGKTVSLFAGDVSTPTELVLESYYENGLSKIRASWTPSTSQGDIIYKIYHRRNEANWRPVDHPYTYDNFIEMNIEEFNEGQEIQIVVQAMRQATGVVSDSLIGYVKAAKVVKDNPNNIVRGNIVSPTPHDISVLCANAGIPVDRGLEVTYLQLNDAGDILSSQDFVFESMSLTPITQKVNNDIIAASFDNLIVNGDFSDTDDWLITDGAGGTAGLVISDGKLNVHSHTSMIFALQVVSNVAIGKKHKLEFTVSEGSDFAAPEFTLLILADMISTERIVQFRTTFQDTNDGINIDITEAGTYSHEFVASTEDILVGIINFSSSGGFSYDDISLTREDEKAEHSILLSLPPSVTSDVTWSYTFEPDSQVTSFTTSNSIGMVDPSTGEAVTGVSTTFSGFDDSMVVNERKSVEVGLTRESDAVGFSQFEVEVTATWNQTINFAGIDVDVPKTASEVVLLSARVR